MREIKFRVWNTELKDWRTISIKGDKIVKTNPSDKIMQFTGLKDKNGKEIFEGDIVKGTWGKDNIDIFKIIWEDERACFGGEDKDGEPCVFDDYNGNLEVIGNIYEDITLLQRKAK